MKRTFNLTTFSDDLDRYRDRDDLLSALDGFDGVLSQGCHIVVVIQLFPLSDTNCHNISIHFFYCR